MKIETFTTAITVPTYVVEAAAEDIAKAWSKAFDPDDPPCPPMHVIEHALTTWITSTVEDLLEDADWYICNSDHRDGRRLCEVMRTALKEHKT